MVAQVEPVSGSDGGAMIDGRAVWGLPHVIWVWVEPLRKYVQMVGFADG